MEKNGEFHDPGISVSNDTFVEELYEQYNRDPANVSPDWRRYFEAFERQGEVITSSVAATANPFASSGQIPAPPIPGDASVRLASPAEIDQAILQERVDQLIRNYRIRGHLIARIDPLNQPRPVPEDLELDYYGLGEEHLQRTFSTASTWRGQWRSLQEILDSLRRTYCRYIGVQYMHIDDLVVRDWLQQRMEGTENSIKLRRREQLRILTRLTDATVFEEYIQKKYLGAKSFSLEGAESLVPLLDLAIEKAGADGIDEIVLGMAHRGRLNVLVNIMGKSGQRIFSEFEDVDPLEQLGGGDVKYHLGYSSDWKCENGRKVHLSLCFNPSHLEFVNPVALGKLRARLDRRGDTNGSTGVVILIHGDAAFAGEGIVQETLNLSELNATQTGGTIHVIVNNQIGFTTTAEQGRSCQYSTDVAKMLQIPIFHVNGEDPEAVAQVVHLAMEFRKQFHRDVVIDMYCYRRRGHNEQDEPSFTQPLMYRYIDAKSLVRESYLKRLLKLGEVTTEEAERIAEERKAHFDRERDAALRRDAIPVGKPQTGGGIWANYRGGLEKESDLAVTGGEIQEFADLLRRQTKVPDGFHPHPKLVRLLETRRKMAEGKLPLDWASAEAIAFAALADSGFPIRFSGQDVERGTFSHRHAVLHDFKDDRSYIPLQHISMKQAPVHIHNSALSEAGCLGFEYGYSLDCPEGLTLWEAQFGDFCNAAQVIIDQFIVSAEDKWKRLSGIVLLLPHGFEGQGPEHSSARLERFLMLAAEDNIQIVYPTTPAQYFHVLRRQVMRKYRKPLVVMTPKSLLRSKDATSTLEELATGQFNSVIPEPRDFEASEIRRVLMCSGKIYYELERYRIEHKRDDVAIVRVEQLYPHPMEEVRSALAGVPEDAPVVWVQEEPENMGAWRFIFVTYGGTMLDRHPLLSACRPASASPATGSKRSHDHEQRLLIETAFGDTESAPAG